jgi:predicted P-loop ATPase
MQLNEGAYSTRGTLVFAGQQNIGKTFFLQMLTGDMWKYCLDGLTLNPSDRDSIKKFCSHWIIELGELDATFRKSDISALKAFLTLKKDTMRLAYGRGESTFPRRTVSIASVNDRTFLRDDTGNSRYWCLPVERFDFQKLRGIDIQQLWAEVWQHVKFALEVDPVGLPWFLNQEESDQLETNNANFEEPCEITATLIRYIKPHGTEESWCTSKELWSAKDIAQLLQLDNSVKTLRTIGKVMRERLGYEFEPPIRNRCYYAFVPDLSSDSIAKSFRNLARE